MASLYRLLQPLGTEGHAGLRWSGPTIHGFASEATRLPMCAAEALHVAAVLPFVFERQPNGQFQPVVLCSVFSDRNMLIGPDGRWTVGYQPAVLRGYPFGWLRTEAGQLSPALDVASPNVSRNHGEPLWLDSGQLSPRTAEIVGFLTSVAQDFERTAILTKQIADLGLLQNDLVIDGGERGAHRYSDLRVVKAEAVSALPDSALRELHTTGALSLLYLHHSSQNHLLRLFQIEQARQAAEVAPAPLDLSLFG